LDEFDKDQILESRLFTPSAKTDSAPPKPASFIEVLSTPTPTPGGGSAAAYAGAMGAALVSMVSGLTINNKRYVDVQAEMQAIRTVAEHLRKKLSQAVEDDAGAFEALMGTFRLPKDTEEQKTARKVAIIQATLNAAYVPLQVAADAVKVMEVAIKCAKSGNVNAISDAMSGFAMARASLTAAGYNVRINIDSLGDVSSSGGRMLQDLSELEKKADELEAEIKIVMKERGGV
jgi:formiminotetrahydrofolate cyclodeaminase